MTTETEYPPISRRDFLRLSALGLLSLSAIPFGGGENEPSPIVDFNFIGPPIYDISDGGSEGERTIWVNPDNPNKIMAGTWSHGFWATDDGGKNWHQEVPLPNDNTGNGPDIQRDIVSLSENEQFIVSDFSGAIRTESDSGVEWKDALFPFARYLYFGQTGCKGGGDTILVGGYGGICWANLSEIGNATPWHRPEMDFVMIRSIKYDEKSGTILAGGWTSPNNSPMAPGTGLLVSRDNGRSFTKHPDLFDKLWDARGPLAINSIEIAYYKGHQIIFVGSEGGGVENGRIASESFPFLFIIVDGFVYPRDKINLPGLASAGGADIITPQNGFAASPEKGRIFVSTYAKHISSASLEDIIQGRSIEWQRISEVPEGSTDFGAVHIRLTKNGLGDTRLVVGRQVWGKKVSFQPIAVGTL